IHGPGGSPFQWISRNNEMLDSFGGCIKSLQEQGVERNSVAKTLLGCFVDVFNMYHNLAELRDPFGDTCSSLQGSFSEAAKETSELINEADKQSDTATNDQLDQIRQSINKLFTVEESVLVEFIAMHKTVAEVSYMLGDAFTTGGTGMRGLSDVTHPGTSSKHGDQLMDFNLNDFPWDKHNVPSATIGLNSKKLSKYYEGYSLS
ncbi:hypothetical protein C5167_051180, partial [Papaver somniferum]